jgi:hypothetical protein
MEDVKEELEPQQKETIILACGSIYQRMKGESLTLYRTFLWTCCLQNSSSDCAQLMQRGGATFYYFDQESVDQESGERNSTMRGRTVAVMELETVASSPTVLHLAHIFVCHFFPCAPSLL